MVDNNTNQDKKKKFEALFLPLMDNLYNIAMRMTRNASDAEDLVQETYLKAFRFFDHFQEGTNARAWVITILTNTFRTRYRKHQKEPGYVDFDSIENFFLVDEMKPQIQPANKSEAKGIEAITEILKEYVSDDIINALENVPEQFRLAVLLSDVERFNYQEIAEIVGTSVGTVKSRIFRGRKILQKQLLESAKAKGIAGKKNDKMR
jgi:RNA polymerase sigma-70 factor (ECF subfamily)